MGSVEEGSRAVRFDSLCEMATLGKKRNRPSLEARMRGLAGQARKVELAEPAIRAHRQAQQRWSHSHSAPMMTSQYGATTDPSDNRRASGAGRRAANALHQSKQSLGRETARSEISRLSDDEPRRTTLMTQKKLDNDGEWDMIVQYNQREGRRIAAMAAQEIN